MVFQNPSGVAIKRLLESAKTIAVVGLSPKPDRPSYAVSQAMQGFGYRIVPVSPAVDEVLGEKAYPDLDHLPEPVNIVDVFRAPEHVDAIVDQCIVHNLPALWLQEGVVNEKAAERAVAAGILVVMDRCIYKDYVRYVG